jgi:hypothetical protein
MFSSLNNAYSNHTVDFLFAVTLQPVLAKLYCKLMAILFLNSE